MNWKRTVFFLVLAAFIMTAQGFVVGTAEAAKEPIVAKGLPNISVEGKTDLPGNFFLSFVFSRNLIMLNGKGEIVWS